MTGLKLGRVPKGRTPPAPHGRYILTESGEHILTEITPPDNVPLYSTGVWYDTIQHIVYDYPNKRRFRWSGDTELQIFGFYFNGDSSRWIMFISDSPLSGTTFYFDWEHEVLNPSTWEYEVVVDTTPYIVPTGEYFPSRAGNFYVNTISFTFNTGSLYDYPDFEYKEFSRTETLNDVCDYVATFKASPLITEGG